MSSVALPVSSLRSAWLKLSLFVFAVVSLLLPAAVSAQQTFTGGAIAVTRTQTGPSSSTATISSPTGSSIATIKIVLNGLTTDGTACTDGNCWSLLPTSFYLQSPHGGPKLVLLGGTGDGIDGDDLVDAGSGLNNATITIQDGANPAPNDVAWTPKTGSFTVKPSSYFLGAGQTPPLGSEADFPQTDGSATFNSRFAGIGIANGDVWTLTIENGEGLTTPINISSWQMIVTYASTTPTTTSVSSSQNPAFTTSPNNSVTLTATISTSSGTPTGTVAFTDNGNTISGCGAVALSGGHAICTTTNLAQGYHTVEAAYGGGGGFGQSSGSLIQLIEVHPTQSSNTWCNNTSFSAPLNGTGIVYPAVIPVSGYGVGSTVGNVTIELQNVTEGAAGAGIEAQFLLVAPGGANDLDFLDSAFNGDASGAVNLFISDSGSNTPSYGTAVNNDTYVPWDGNTQTSEIFPAANSPIVDSGIPLVPGTINYPLPHGHTNSMTLQQAFNGAPANGDWALYATASNGSDALTVGGWCVTLDVNSGVGTTTSLSSSAQKASLGSSVTLTATVTVQGTSTPVTSGTVEFKDETTGNVLASANPLNGSGVASVTVSNLAEGDHHILASYSGTGSFNTSFATLYQRIDKATGVTAVNSNTWQFCNTGAITIAEGSSGAETPNPSNISVSNLPGTLNTATLTLNNFSILVGDQLDNTESLVVGPTGAALDFFSNTAGGTIEDEALAGNYVFADSASGLVSSGSGNISPGTYQPTSYVGNGNDVFTADPGGFFTLPGSFGYSASRGTSTFANKFTGTNPVGTWSLYFNSPNANLNGTGAAGGWCVNLTENLPTVSVTKAHSGNFSQGQSNAAFTVVIDNNGTNGPTGDPTGTNPMTVKDTLNSAFTYSTFSGTNWSCSASGQLVTCTNDSAIAQGSSYPTLTIDVNVAANSPNSVTNSVSVSGAGVANTNSNTDTVAVDQPPTITSANSATFTVGTAGSFTVTTTGFPTASISESGTLPSGVTLTDNGNGTATLSGTPAANSGGAYSFTITASNGSSPNGTQSFTLSVDQAPSITSANSTTFTVGTAGSFTVTSSGYPAPTPNETGTLPSGVSVTNNGNGTGLISGTPAAGTAGSYPITLTMTNGVGSPATQSFTLSVDGAPAITSAASTTFTVGSLGSFTVTASGFPAPTFSETGALPSGVTLSSAGVLSGTPAANSGGTYVVSITASNGVGSNAIQSFTLTVQQPPSITSANATSFTSGTLGTFTVTTTGSPTSALSETGALPTGVTFTDNGNGTATITGTAGLAAAYPFTITAQNGVSPNATQSFTLTVNPGAASYLTIPGGPEPFYTAFGFNIFAYDAAGNLATGYNGTVAFTSSDPGFVNLGPITLVNGVGTQTGVLKTAGTDSITATDISNPSITGTGFFTIQPGVATHIGLVAPGAAYAGSPISVTLTAYDLYGNVATSYGGTVVFTSSDPNAVLPGSTAISNGTGTFSATMETVGSQTITATDAGNSLSATTGSIIVTLPNLVVTTATDDAGTASNCTIQQGPGAGTDASCSLRDALLFAASEGSGSITFDSAAFASAQTITLSNGTLTVPSNAIVTGPTSGKGSTQVNLVTVNGGGSGSSTSPVFSVSSSALNAELANLTITGGNDTSGSGGGISNGYAAALTVMNSTISGNADPTGTGGIFNDYNATLTVINSTISGNSGGVGGIDNQGGGTVTVTGSTISGNSASSGGGIVNAGASLTVTASTISGNAATFDAGGILTNAGTVTLANTIVSGNTATTNPNIDGSYTDNGGNQIGTGVNLAPLGSYGGPTQTQLPLPGSLAICGGTSANDVSLIADQRGLPFDPACPSGSVDAGSVQTNYALAFTIEPPASFFTTQAISPAPVVALTESGVPATAASSAITMTDTASLVGGTTTANLAAGSAAFSNLVFSTATGSDMLTATLALNSTLTPALNLTAQSTGFTVNTIPPITLSATSLDFGRQVVDTSSLTQDVIVTNNTAGTVSLSSITVGGTNPTSFVFGGTTTFPVRNSCKSTLAAGASCFVHGHFAPTTTGPLSAAVTITDSASNSPQSISVAGIGIDPNTTTLSLTSTDLEFAPRAVGTSSPTQDVTLTNTGGAILSIVSFAVTGPNASSFSFATDCPRNVAIGASCLIHGHFTPTAAGPLTATLMLTNSATGSPQSIALSGFGIALQTATLSSTSLTFAARNVGTTSASQSVTLTNNGGEPLHITSITVTGANASSFGFSNNCGNRLAAGASCTIHGHFTPTATGPLNAAITITDNAGDSPQSVSLSGTGQ